MNHDLQIISISGIDCYERDGTAYLKLDIVARGLGFTKTDVKISETGFRKEYVRIDWPRVIGYLKELGFSQEVGKDDFIPENIFYRLAMKAKNEAAESFQAKIADEVIPAIRKTGGYNPKPMSPTEMFAMQAQINLDYEKKFKTLEGELENTNKKFDTVANFMTAPYADGDTWKDRTAKRIKQAVEEFGLNYQTFHKELYDELERTAGVDLRCRQTRRRNRMWEAGATKTECKGVSKLSIVADDKKLRAMFETILRNHVVQLAASRGR